MWPWSTIKRLRAQITMHEAVERSLREQLRMSRSTSERLSGTVQTLRAELAIANKNDARDAKGRFTKRQEADHIDE